MVLERKTERLDRLRIFHGTRYIWCIKRDQMIAVDICVSNLSECRRPRQRASCREFTKYWEGVRKEKAR